MGLIAWFRRERQWRREHFAAFSAAAQKQADGLTLFQHQAIAAVSRFVPPTSFRHNLMTDREEEYLVAPLGTRGAELYLYLNEASILGAKPERRFEEWDYHTPADLLRDLVEECEARAA